MSTILRSLSTKNPLAEEKPRYIELKMWFIGTLLHNYDYHKEQDSETDFFSL